MSADARPQALDNAAIVAIFDLANTSAMARLRALKGAEFDGPSCSMNRPSRLPSIAAVNTTLLLPIQNQELKDFVTSLAPAFEAHRVMAEHLEKKLAP